MITDNQLLKIIKTFNQYHEIKLTYLFGSQNTGNTGLLSDYDFCIYLDHCDKKKMFEIKCKLQDQIARILQNDQVDIVILNMIKSPELKYNIIKSGKLIYEIEPYRVFIEPKILNEYFDYYYLISKYNLTGVKQ